MLLAVPHIELRDLPFDAACATVKEWFAALSISQQSLVLTTLETANEVDTAMVTAEPEPAQPGSHRHRPRLSRRSATK